ncbi:leucine-rich repeat-containing G-protein coupled receptor 5-like [Anopheles moucheti]|uniref:leucine-rich repeat-containing G-protein coupled receptor 5-like n=1 Tax=Anopheles moucheti TaxID=186751 RepID=UPI0022F0704E|nr:leucine-rich repeat-containing G-protein coupled receptor 5-like [Anopheles moucheti]
MQEKCAVCFVLLCLAVGASGYSCEKQDYYSTTAIFYNMTIEASTIPRFKCDSYYGLTIISFKNCTVEELPKQLFDSFNSIHIANLTRSGIKYVNRYSLERAISLQILDLSWNALSELTANCFAGASQVTKLVLSYNSISSIDAMAFNSLVNLNFLLLTGNKLRLLHSTVFKSLVALQTIYLDSNELQVIERNLFSNNGQLQNIILKNNRISVVEEGAFTTDKPSNLSILSLSNNNLTKLNLSGVKVKKVYASNNKLEEIYLSSSIELVHARNNTISNILMDNSSKMDLTTLDLDNNSITSFESINHLTSLVNLFLSNNRIGPVNLTSFAKLTKLEQLGLERTHISNLQHGTFAQQESLKWLDLSYNNLDRFDFDILTSSTALEKIFLDGNRLKSLDFQYLRKTFPSLVKIGLSDNNWNCTYLIKLVRYCTEHSIALFKSQSSVLNQTNVKGIYCYDDKNPLANLNTTMQQMQILHPHLNGSTEDGALQSLLQSVLEDVRRFSDSNADVANQTTKLDGAVYDLTKNQFALQKDLNGLRQSLFEIRLALMSNRTNGSAGVNNDELRRMIETANNLTLDKQELSAKTLEFKVYEQTFKVDKALELAKENSDKIALLAKGKQQCNNNVADFSGVSLMAQDRQQQQHLLQPSAAHASGGSGDHGLIVTLVVMMCLMMGVIVFGVFKFNRRLFNVERNRYANRDSSLATIIHDQI